MRLTLVIAAAMAAALPSVAHGQVLYNQQPSASVPQATTDAIAAAQTAAAQAKAQADAAMASMPQPSNVVGSPEAVGGAAGSATTYKRGDWVPARITRAGTTVTDGSGAWSITWASSLEATPVVLPIPVDGGTQPVMCTVATRTTTGATGRCFRSQLLPSTLTLLSSLVSFNVLGGLASGVTVQVLAIPPTQ